MAFPTIPTTGNGRLAVVNQLNTTATRTFPAWSSITHNAGDLIIAIVIGYQSSTTDAQFSGWSDSLTELHDTGTSSTLAIGVAYKWATGSESGSATVTQAATITGDASMILMSIPGAHPSTAPEAGTRANGTTAAADPGSLNPAGWGTEDTLWIALAGSGLTNISGTWTATGTTAPTNYGNRVDTNASDTSTVGDCEAAVAFRQLNAASEDVGTAGVDTSNARNSALVIAVRPFDARSAAAGDIAQAQGFALTGKKAGAAALGALAQAESFSLVGRKGGIRALGDQSLAIGLAIASGKSVAKALGTISATATQGAMASHKGGQSAPTFPQASSLTALGRKGGKAVLGALAQAQGFSIATSGGHRAALGALAQASSLAGTGRKGGVSGPLGTISVAAVLSITGRKGHQVALGTITASPSLVATIRKGGLGVLANLAQAYDMAASGVSSEGGFSGPAGDITVVASLAAQGHKGGLVALTFPQAAGQAATGRKGALGGPTLAQVTVLALQGVHGGIRTAAMPVAPVLTAQGRKGVSRAAGTITADWALLALGRKGALVTMALDQAYAMLADGTGVNLVGIIHGSLVTPTHRATVGGGYASGVGGEGAGAGTGGGYDGGLTQPEYDTTVED